MQTKSCRPIHATLSSHRGKERETYANEKKRQRKSILTAKLCVCLVCCRSAYLEESVCDFRLLSSTATNKVCQGTENPSPWPLSADLLVELAQEELSLEPD